jgi:hypothetical protein
MHILVYLSHIVKWRTNDSEPFGSELAHIHVLQRTRSLYLSRPIQLAKYRLKVL